MKIEVGDIIKTRWMKDDHHIKAYKVEVITMTNEGMSLRCSDRDRPKDKDYVVNGLEYINGKCLCVWRMNLYNFNSYRLKEPFTDDMFTDMDEVIIIEKNQQKSLF